MMAALTVCALAALALYRWRRRKSVPPDTDDWPLLPPRPEVTAQLDEHGRVELLVREFDDPPDRGAEPTGGPEPPSRPTRREAERP